MIMPLPPCQAAALHTIQTASSTESRAWLSTSKLQSQRPIQRLVPASTNPARPLRVLGDRWCIRSFPRQILRHNERPQTLGHSPLWKHRVSWRQHLTNKLALPGGSFSHNHRQHARACWTHKKQSLAAQAAGCASKVTPDWAQFQPRASHPPRRENSL